MKRNYFVVLLLLISKLAIAQFITPTSYRGAFAPAPAAMWTDQWTNFDPQNTTYPAADVVVSSNITTNTTWTANHTYKLSGQIYVTGNATLTIEAGTVILGDHTVVGACLLIAKGSKLIANGTASQPIVFTSDNAPGARNKGDWGGVILLGKGAYNLNSGVANVEGLADSADTKYGGGLTPDNADNSGSLKYVRIEFPGYVYALNTEINGLTMGAVGSGTTIDYVQVSHSNDDSFEWFGGAVNCKHLVAYRGLDDDFDTDNGYSGNCQFGLGVRDPQVSDAPAVSTSEGFESDNNASSTSVTPYTAAIFTNFTMVGPNYRLTLPNGGTLASGYKRAARIRRNSQLKIYNSVFMDYNEGVHVDGLTTETNALNGTLQFRDNVIAGTVTTSKVYQVNTTGNNASFNIATWYTASNNTTAATNAGLLTNPYNSTSATIYTGLDYRPATGSILLNSANFNETSISTATAVIAPVVVSPVNLNYGQTATALTATLVGATSLNWYTVATGGTASATAPTPATNFIGSITYYVSQVRNGVEGPRAAIVVNVNAVESTLITPTSYRGAFAPAPAAMWTDQWTNFDPQNTTYPAADVVVSSNITTNTTWTANHTYKLSGQIYVTGNATLTIEAGTVILGDHTVVGACLLIAKGSKLIANGTASQPIVFTSDNAPGARNKGDWGGVILLGKGAYNLNSGVANVEGLADSADTKYGGGLTPDNADNSGSLKYVRIEFPGYVYALNTEINGLTMGAVGSGTTIDYVQVSHSNDDSFEWFGGAVNCKHLVAYRGLDDDFDTDNGYSGNCQFGLGVRDPQVSDAPAVSTSEGFESDNNASSTSVTPYTAAIFTNFTMVGPNYRLTLPNGGTLASGYKRAARIRRNSQLKIYNSVFMDYNEGVHVDGLTTETNALNGTLQFRDNVIAGTVTTSKVYQVNTTVNNASFNIATWYAASNNTTATTNAGLLVNPYNSTSATIYTGLDYRPAAGSILLNSAHFDETALGSATALVAPEVASPVNLCYTQVASPLTATLLGGTSLKWYTVATGGTALATAPTPATTVVGTKTYYVSQVRNGIESLRTAIVVNVNALPTTPGSIIGTTAQGVLVGTSTTATYLIADVAGAVSYSWTAPAGVNILSGQGTNTIVVNFLNVAPGAGSIGNLVVRSVNENGCSSAAKTLSLTKALPTAPVLLSLTNGVTTTAITNISAYVGTTTPLTLTAGNVTTATSYAWNLPAGVNQVSGGNSRIIQVNFAGLPAAEITAVVIGVSSVNGVGTSTTAKTLSLTRALPTAPLVLSMTNPASATPTTAITNASMFIGTSTPLTLTATAVTTAASYVWTLPAGVNQVGGGANDRIIQVNFANVAPGNTGVALPISIAAVNGVGTSALKTLALTRTVPTAPTTLYLTNPASATPTTAITASAIYLGTSTPLTLTASAVTTASSYDWVLPAGVNQVGGGAHDRIIQVNFADVPAGNAGVALPISVYGVNGVGSSVAKTLSLTRVLPSTLVTVAGQIGAICGGNSYSYTMTPALYTTSYQITAPAGSFVTSASNPSNASNVLETSDLTFSVALPANFSTLAVKTIVIYSKNGVGLSATAKTLTLNPASPTIPAVNGGTTFTTCANVTFSVADMVGASSYTWTMANGAVIVSGQSTNTVVVSFASVTVASTLLRVKAISNCGVAGADKYITLTNAACAVANNDTTTKISNVSEVYPNPVVDTFTLEMESSKVAAAQMQVFTFEGNLLLSKQINLAEGTNTVSESVSELKKGLYIVKITNEATNDVVVKKMIKQ